MVLYGIKVNKRILSNYNSSFAVIHIGEQNIHYNRDQYACSFSKLIYYWRQTWNQRTNGITDIQFPFGFVQVSLIRIYSEFNSYINRHFNVSI